MKEFFITSRQQLADNLMKYARRKDVYSYRELVLWAMTQPELMVPKAEGLIDLLIEAGYEEEAKDVHFRDFLLLVLKEIDKQIGAKVQVVIKAIKSVSQEEHLYKWRKYYEALKKGEEVPETTPKTKTFIFATQLMEAFECPDEIVKMARVATGIVDFADPSKVETVKDLLNSSFDVFRNDIEKIERACEVKYMGVSVEKGCFVVAFVHNPVRENFFEGN